MTTHEWVAEAHPEPGVVGEAPSPLLAAARYVAVANLVPATTGAVVPAGNDYNARMRRNEMLFDVLDGDEYVTTIRVFPWVDDVVERMP